MTVLQAASDTEGLVAIDALGTAGVYRSRNPEVITDTAGVPVAALSLVPPLYVTRTIGAQRKVRPLPIAQRRAALYKTAEIFTNSLTAGLDFDHYVQLASRVSGLPIAVTRAGAQGVADALETATDAVWHARPAGAVFDWREERTRWGCAVWARRGEVFAIHASGNHPGVHGRRGRARCGESARCEHSGHRPRRHGAHARRMAGHHRNRRRAAKRRRAAPPTRPAHRSAAVPVHVRPLGTTGARLRLTHPLPLRVGDIGLLRDPGEHRIAAGIEVLDVRPPKLRRRGAARARADELATGRVRPPVCARAKDLRAMGFEATGQRVGEWVVDPQWWAERRQQMLTAVRQWATEHDIAAGMPLKTASAG